MKWRPLTNLLPCGPVTRRRMSNHSTAALTPIPSPTMLGAGGKWYGQWAPPAAAANRLYALAEVKGWINAAQAGFRKHHSCEDQILGVTQSISDGFQTKPGKRSVLVLLDYSKAYDKVWREELQELLMTMHEVGVPAVFLQWFRGFLLNRQARVSYNDTLGRTRRIRQGLPQGSVLSPLLFLFYINSVSDNIPKSVNCAMYADDVSLWASHRCKESVSADILQQATLLRSGAGRRR